MKKIKDRIQSVYRLFCKLELTISAAALVLATLILCIAAIFRTAGRPLGYTTEISLCLFAWCIFLGADVAYRHNKLVYVEVVLNKAPKRAKQIIYGIIYLVIAAFLCLFLYESIKLTSYSWIRRWTSIPALSYGWIAMSVPFGSLMLLVTTVIQFYQYAVKARFPKSAADEELAEVEKEIERS